MKHAKCGQEQTSCDRCETDGVCPCCPCECEYADPAPAAVESMKRYDAAKERQELAVDGREAE